MLAVRDIDVSIGGNAILRSCSVDVQRAEVLAVRGPSGCGKSTLLRAIAGLLTVQRGTITIDGDDVTNVPTSRRGVGMVFQDNQLFGHLDVAGNIGFGLRMQRAPTSHARTRVAEMLDLVGLTHLAHRAVHSLSGGEAKRVALARSLAPAPRALLLDEPLTGLDDALHDQLMSQLATVLAELSITTVLVTHSAVEAERLAHRVVELQGLMN
jgi:thiamine transport system ATP-binding protein